VEIMKMGAVEKKRQGRGGIKTEREPCEKGLSSRPY
jgi:hypothetical protein